MAQAAAYHRLVPQVESALGVVAPPELVGSAVAAVTQSMRLVAALERVSSTLDTTSGDWALVKGLALASRYHGAFDARQTSDLDVLVRREHFRTAVASLTDAGVAPALGWRRALARGSGEVPLRVSAHVTLDLHWSLLHSPEARQAFSLPTDELLEDTVSVEIVPGLTAPTTSTPDTLLHLAYHTAVSGPERLGPLDDLRRVALAVEDWDEVVVRARRRRLALMLGCMLGRVEQTFGALPLAPDTRRSLGWQNPWRGLHHVVDVARPPAASFGRRGHGRLVVGSTRETTAASLGALTRHVAEDATGRLRGRPTLSDTRFPTPVVHLRLLLLSLEAWDDVWRRNQHLVRALVDDWFVESVTFVEPPARHGQVEERSPYPRVRAIRPVQPLPDKLGGKVQLARWIRTELLGQHDVLWINDAPLGRWVLDGAIPTVHDVTDDWREIEQPWDARHRLVTAEDWLAARARTVVCSEVLAQRWYERYHVRPDVIPNAVDLSRYGFGTTIQLPGAAPHVLYAGTLHRDRLDLALLHGLAALPEVGTLHLLGPDMLPTDERAALEVAGVRIHPPIPGPQVSLWLQAADLLVLPHRVDQFTLSLDAIKAYEYQAAHRPVVATPTSGFQHLADSGMAVVDPLRFVGTVAHVLRGDEQAAAIDDPPDWRVRSTAMAAVLRDLVDRGYPPVTDL